MNETPYKINPEWERLGSEANMHIAFDPRVMAELEKAADLLRQQHMEQVNNWTRGEFVRLLGQVIASGDFKMLVAPDDHYGAVYLPWDECQKAQSRVAELEEEIATIRRDCYELDHRGEWVLKEHD